MTDAKADYVRTLLPIAVPAGDLDRNPEFAKLLAEIGERYLTKTGASKTCSARVEKATLAMQQDKARYLQREALYRELRDILTETTGTRDEMRERLELLLSIAEAKNCLDLSNVHADEGVTVLGLHSSDLDALARSKLGGKIDQASKHPIHAASRVTFEGQEQTHALRTQLQPLQQALIPEVESRMKRKCESIHGFYSGGIPETAANGDLGLAKASQLPQIVAGDRERLAVDTDRLEANRHTYLRLSQEHIQIMLKSIAAMDAVVNLHRLQLQPQADDVAARFIAAKCDAMCLKLSVLKHQIISETYTPDTVAALKKIRAHLDDAHKKAVAESAQSTAALSAYESVGMGFSSLVSEYASLLEEIENRRWALSELSRDV